MLLAQLEDHPADVADAGVRQREVRVELDRLLEHLQGEVEVLAPGVAAPAQVVVVGLQVLGRLARDRLLFLRRQGDAQRLRDAARDLVLDGEHVLELAVVALGPRRVAGAGLDELRRDPEAVAGAADAPLEHVRRVELLADLGCRDRLVAEADHLRAREDPELRDLRELGDDVFGHPVAEVLVVLHAAQVLEVEDGHRFLRRRRRRRRGRARPRLRRRRVAAGVAIALEPLQVGLQLRGALVAQLRVLLERLGDHPLELRRHLAVHVGRPARHLVQHRGEHHRRGVALEGRTPGRHLVEDRAEREEVGPGIERLAPRLLRRHVVHRAHRRARVGQLHVGHRRAVGAADEGGVRGELGEAEVEDLELARRGHEDVRGLDVAVDDALGVGGLERLGDAERELEQPVDPHRPPVDHGLEGVAFEQFHHHERLALVLADLVDGADVRVIQRGGRSGFAQEAFDGGAVAASPGAAGT